MTYSANIIAKYFIQKANVQLIKDEEGEEISEGITNLKLQKILYFAHAFYLVKKGEALIDEKFQAWMHGPVLNNLYHTLKTYKNNIIPNDAISDETSSIDKETKLILDNVWEDLGKYSAFELVRMSHEHGPWRNFYQEGKPNNEIPNDIIAEQFSNIFID